MRNDTKTGGKGTGCSAEKHQSKWEPGTPQCHRQLELLELHTTVCCLDSFRPHHSGKCSVTRHPTSQTKLTILKQFCFQTQVPVKKAVSPPYHPRSRPVYSLHTLLSTAEIWGQSTSEGLNKNPFCCESLFPLQYSGLGSASTKRQKCCTVPSRCTAKELCQQNRGQRTKSVCQEWLAATTTAHRQNALRPLYGIIFITIKSQYT